MWLEQCFWNLKKASGTVNHEKAAFLKTSSQLVDIIFGVQSVKINGATSALLEYKTGIPQGSMLGLLLFCLNINELSNICTEAECQL